MKTGCKGNLSDLAFASRLLEWRNTPKEHGCSPAQLVFGHSLRSKVPTSPELLHSEVPDDFLQKRKQLSQRDKENYNAHGSDLKPLQVGQRVRVQDHATKKWDITGVVTAVDNNRGYHVKLDRGRTYWRNRRFIRPDTVLESSTPMDNLPASESSPPESTPPESSSPGGKRRKKKVKFDVPEQPARRSQRHRKHPDRLGVVPRS